MVAPIWRNRDEYTVARLIEERLESDPDGELFDVNGDKWTARTMIGEADRVANTFAEFGVQRGDRVATLTENSSEAVVSLFAANRRLFKSLCAARAARSALDYTTRVQRWSWAAAKAA